MRIDHHLLRQPPLPGQFHQMRGAVHLNIKPGIHLVPDAGALRIPFSASIRDIKHLIKIHVQVWFSNDPQISVFRSRASFFIPSNRPTVPLYLDVPTYPGC